MKKLLLNPLTKVVGIIVTAMVLSSCGLKYNIKSPEFSKNKYKSEKETSCVLSIIDKRTGSDATFIMGKIGLGSSMKDISDLLKFENISNPIEYFSQNLEKEMTARGVLTKCTVVGQSNSQELTMEINKYQILNYRATGFSPWEACHVFSGTLIDKGKKINIKAYAYNGKVPVWSMSEIQEPCFETPMSMIVKEVASKVIKNTLNLQYSDGNIEQLVKTIDESILTKTEDNHFWEVLELGYGNNKGAIPSLKKFTTYGNEFFKACALTAIAIIGPEEHFDFLKNFHDSALYSDRYIAVKAIGDIGTLEAIQFVRNQKNDKAYDSDGGLKSCVDLYLYDSTY